MQELTGRDLRRLSRSTPRGGPGRRRALAAALVTVGLALLGISPVLASTAPAYRLQGSDLPGEFVVQPYWLTPGQLAGRHVRLEAGLLGFTDGAGHNAGGYCVDARAHRRHDAAYTAGPQVDDADVANARQVRWLLANAFPNGTPLLGADRRGLARSGSAVQAAIWHYADGFELDPAGSPQVDVDLRRAYDALVARAAAAPGVTTGSGRVDLGVVTGPSGTPARITARIVGDDGGAVADGTPVTLSTDWGRISTGAEPSVPPASGTLVLPTSAGVVRALLLGTPGAGTVRATVSLPLAPGHLLVSSLPTQRLVETGWAARPASAEARMVIPAPPPPPSAPPASPQPTPAHPAPSASPAGTSPPAPAAAPLRSSIPVAIPSATPPPSAPTTPPPRPPATPANIVMPSTGHPAARPVSLAVGLVLVGAGLLLGCPPRQRLRSRRTNI